MNTTEKSAPRILIADDDHSIRQLLTTIVRRERLVVDAAADGAEAIEKLQEHEYAVILLDLMMPRVDGYAVLAHMRKHQPELLPCMILATAAPERDLERNLKDPVYMVHTKPFDMRQLIADVRHCAKLDAA